MKNLFCRITSENNNKQYLVSYFYKHVAFLRYFLIKTLGCSLIVHTFFWLDRKYCRWNCGNIWGNTLTFTYRDNIVRLPSFICFSWPSKFNLTSGVFIFLFMVTERGIIFIRIAGTTVANMVIFKQQFR